MSKLLNNKSIIFVAGGTSGGTTTLAYRIGKEYSQNGYDVYFLCNSISDKNNAVLLTNNNINLICEKTNRWKKILSRICNESNDNTIITFSYEYFGIINYVKNRVDNTKCFLYVVNTRCLVKGLTSTNKYIRMIGRIINQINRAYINKMYLNNQLIFMDSVVIDVSQKYLSLSFKNSNDYLFLLPYDISIVSGDNNVKKNIILTMSRISFPFKGYICGLMDIFSKLDNSLQSELWIIGDGLSMNELKTQIYNYPDEIKGKIKLFYNISYDKIGEILKQSKVFVGMGTSVLDAVANGIPSFAVMEYSYECLGRGVFCDYPYYVYFSDNDEKTHSLYNDILNIMTMDNNEYFNVCIDCMDALKKNYSIKNFYKKLNQMKNKNIRFSFIDRIGYFINCLALKIYIPIVNRL